MDRISALITRADYLRRHIYSSIPFEDRLAALFVKLSIDTVEAFGRALGAEFLLRGVTDMPDPGPRWDPKSRNPALTLPRDYMREWASKTYGLMLKKFHDPGLVEEAFSRFLLRVTTQEKIKPQPLHSAQSWVVQGLVWQALDTIKERKEERGTESLDQPSGEDDGRTLQESLEDPNALMQIKRELSPRVWRMWMEYLAHFIHEDIPLYIALEMQGYSPPEIIGDPAKGVPGMLPHYTSPASGYHSYYKYKVGLIPRISKRFFMSIHEEMPIAV